MANPLRQLIEATKARWCGLGNTIFQDWASRDFAAPSPVPVKQAVLLRNGIKGGTWVETGTYMGHTTALLAQCSSKVYSIEPDPKFFEDAFRRFHSLGHVEILNGLSEEILPSLVPTLRGDVNFWLDGHYSGPGTHKGPLDTPVEYEMACIAENLHRMTRAVVMIDDIRMFNGDVHLYGRYPTLDKVVDWARSNRLHWHIEQDIFIARTH